jgi:hypothetical protein
MLLSLRVNQNFERDHLAGVANDGPGTGGGGAPAVAGGGAHDGVVGAGRGPNAAGWLQGGCGADRIGPGMLLSPGSKISVSDSVSVSELSVSVSVSAILHTICKRLGLSTNKHSNITIQTR